MNKKLIMNLQLFGMLSNPYTRKFMAPDSGADGGSAGTGAESGNGEGAGEGDKGSEGDKSFDDVLKDKKYQSEFDKRIAKALEAAKIQNVEIENINTLLAGNIGASNIKAGAMSATSRIIAGSKLNINVVIVNVLYG